MNAFITLIGTAAAAITAAGGAMAAPVRASVAQECFEQAEARYGVNADLLRAIGKVESSLNPSARHLNSDSSRDVGLMQINSSHLPTLKAFGISEAGLLANPCTNINVGAWVLAGFIQKYGSTWRAVGAYNTGSRREFEVSRKVYVAKVQRALARGRSGEQTSEQGSTHSRPAPGAASMPRMVVMD